MKADPIDHTDIQTLINQGMDQYLHWFPEDVPLSKLAETMASMANSEGGVVLIGISPRSGNIQGIIHPQEIIDQTFQASLLTDPTLVLPIPTLHSIREKSILRITVPAGLPHVYSLEGRYFGREGKFTAPLSARKLRQLLVDRGIIHFETRVPPDATFNDLDKNLVEKYLEIAHFPGADSPEDLLIRRGCVRYEGGQFRPTYAGLLLFGKHPQQWLPNATVLAARFSGIAYSDVFIKQDVVGTLPQQIINTEQFIRDHLSSVIRMVGLTHQESPQYPFEAIRELLVNAIAHRDYNIQGDNIHVKMYSNRLEIRSPGELPGPINLNNLLDARFSRNPIIVQILSDFGFVERLGYGLHRTLNAMKKNGLRPPYFEEIAHSFQVTIYGEDRSPSVLPDISKFRNYSLNERQELALGYLAQQNRINNRTYQELCPDVHPETLRRDLVEMVKLGIIMKIGDKKSTYYILKASMQND